MSTGSASELVQAAFSLIAEKGLEGLRTRDVAGRVGINVATLHYHFATKQKLILAVVDHIAHLFRTLRAPLPPMATSLDELRGFFASTSFQQRAAPELGVVVQEIMLRARRDEQVRAAIESSLRVWHAIVEETVARCVRDGYLPNSVDPKAAAGAITSFLMGANIQLAVTPSSFSLPEASEQVIAWMVGAGSQAKPRK